MSADPLRWYFEHLEANLDRYAGDNFTLLMALLLGWILVTCVAPLLLVVWVIGRYA